MWLASMSLGYTIFRLVIVALLLAVLLTAPPRRLYMRILMGTIAVVLVGYGFYLSMSDSMHLLDIILFYALGFAFGVEALELTQEETEKRIVALHEQYVQSITEPSAKVMRRLVYGRALIDHYGAK